MYLLLFVLVIAIVLLFYFPGVREPFSGYINKCLTSKPYGNVDLPYHYWQNLPKLISETYNKEFKSDPQPIKEKCLKIDNQTLEPAITDSKSMVCNEFYNNPEDFCSKKKIFPCPNFWVDLSGEISDLSRPSNNEPIPNIIYNDALLKDDGKPIFISNDRVKQSTQYVFNTIPTCQ
jgi:hypothetical protein